MFIAGTGGGMGRILLLTLATGACVMTGIGLVMDKLRVRFALWFPLFLAAAVILCIVSINSYPSYERAIRKNGSLAAYVLFACNAGLYVSVVLAVAATVVAKAPRRWLGQPTPED
jgi:hypothetical protein